MLWSPRPMLMLFPLLLTLQMHLYNCQLHSMGMTLVFYSMFCMLMRC